MNRKTVIIAAFDECFGIGKGGKMPWHFKEELKHFKKLTTGSAIVMGKDTYLELLQYSKTDELLPNRESFVVTKSLSETPKATRLNTVKEVFDLTDKDIFFIGGEGIFKEALTFVDELQLTSIHRTYDCDRFFPWQNLFETFEAT